MNTSNFESAIQHTLDNTIWREVDCFTDEIINSKNIYYLYDSNISQDIKSFIQTLHAAPIEEVDYELVSSDSLLVILSVESIDKKIAKNAKKFKRSGGRVIGITANRSSAFVNYTHELLGININNKDKKIIEKAKIYNGVLSEILELIVDKVQKINRETSINV